MPATPRQIVQELLHGTRPPRPLFLPIVFRLGAKLENLPLREFLGNATKISNSLRQIRGHLRADGISCYFDPNLEVEALGAATEWDGDLARVTWPDAGRNGGPPTLKPAEVVAKSGRVAVAIDVIKRLNALVRDGTLLMAGVTGPFTLAAKIVQRGDAGSVEIPSEVLEHAASVTTAVSSAFAEAGANVIFIREDTGCPISRDFREVGTKPSDAGDMTAAPPLRSLKGWDREDFDNWASLLAPTFNVIRFYQSLPVLHFANKDSVEQNRDLILQHPWDCVVTVPIDCDDLRDMSVLGPGLALSACADIDGQAVATAISERHPVLITTTDDLPPSTDVKRLTKVLDKVRR